MSRPAKRMEPLSCLISPATCLMTVDLPAPFGPISAWISPGKRSSVTSSLATTAPKRLESPCKLQDRVRHDGVAPPECR